jgi:peroxiredoxin
MGKWALALLAPALLLPFRLAIAAENSPIGKKIDGFSAKDVDGKPYSLADFADSKLVVVAFMGTECPLAKLYGPRLADLAREFKDRSVAIVVVDSNQQDSIAEIAHYARYHKIDVPILKDVNNVIADQFGAIRTPEMFVLDRDRVIR